MGRCILGVVLGLAALFLVCVIMHKTILAMRSRFCFKGRAIVITGAASGIGRLIALKLSEKQPRALILLDIDKQGLSSVLEELQADVTSVDDSFERFPRILCYDCDVSDYRQVQMIADKIKGVLGDCSPSVLINNAGIVIGKSFLELTEADIQRTFGVNAFSHYWTMKTFLPSMLDRDDGLVVNVSSMMSLIPAARLCDYAASKAAAQSTHDTVRLEMRGRGSSGVHFLSVLPYAVDTGMFEGIFKEAFIPRTFFPPLDPHSVAEEIVQAMELKRTELVCCGVGLKWRVLALAPFFMKSLPTPVVDTILHYSGASSGMKGFRGGQKRNTEIKSKKKH